MPHPIGISRVRDHAWLLSTAITVLVTGCGFGLWERQARDGDPSVGLPNPAFAVAALLAFDALVLIAIHRRRMSLILATGHGILIAGLLFSAVRLIDAHG
ncbi:hypothetical protein CSW57_03990 [Williamsia muralis]|uniref:Uncharacterized protein n=1 Tax=Williamsia marianensis TaxID=85044 RepID=A0A2G3PRG4_WILMA|nr:hypothetical protein CSW57_03990 [Williamsia marianensis]